MARFSGATSTTASAPRCRTCGRARRVARSIGHEGTGLSAVPAGDMMSGMRLFPWRSLRVRLIVLLVLTVVSVLAAATALDIRLSTRVAERNLQERALTLAKEVDILLGSLWGRTDLRNFHHRL